MRRRSNRTVFRGLAVLLVVGAGMWMAFRPAVANHFGYALPTRNGLPCRIHYGGRDYDNDEQCAGINRSSWAVWYDTRHHLQSGGSCATTANLRSETALPLREVAGISTLLGSAHSLMVPGSVNYRGYAPTVLFVSDGACYRPYELSGGP